LRLVIDPRAPEAGAIAAAADVIRSGGIVAMPTDTLYGLAADPANPAAVARVFALKGREAGRALPLVAADLDQVVEHLGDLPPLARRLAAEFWPGPLTLIVSAPDWLSDAVAGGTGRVAVRVPAHPVAQALCRAAQGLLTATSANVSGQPATDDPDAVAVALGDRVDVLLDAGHTVGGPPSTIVDVTGSPPRLVRAGAIAWDQIQRCLDR
jgi:L-threonylcarbamoyladenylate synthase